MYPECALQCGQSVCSKRIRVIDLTSCNAKQTKYKSDIKNCKALSLEDLEPSGLE
jgi:hypothetical protein